MIIDEIGDDNCDDFIELWDLMAYLWQRMLKLWKQTK